SHTKSSRNGPSSGAALRQDSCFLAHSFVVETRLLILNSDPVFQDRALAMFDAMRKVETRIVRTLAEAVCILMQEDFDLFIVEGDAAVAIEQTIHTRQHFPSLK